MSAVDVAVSAVRVVEPEDIRVLRAIEDLMARYEHVPVDAIIRASGLHPREAVSYTHLTLPTTERV